MFVFKEIYKPTIWGGSKISLLKGCDNVSDNIGESWEISAIEGCESVVADGQDEGLTITQLVEKYGDALLGKAVTNRFGKSFPLLFKFIDANADLSIQVHPDDEYAMHQHGGLGKTEMWYVMDSDEDAKLKVGFKKDMTKDRLRKSMTDSTIADKLMTYNVSKGDVFYIPAGRVHTICAGTFLVEIQQSSDITYRLYDYDRVDKEGNKRELQFELAVDVIDYKARNNCRIEYKIGESGVTNLAKCKYFTTNLLKTSDLMLRDFRDIDSFIVLMCMKGSVEIVENKERRTLIHGHTVLIPASADSIQIIPSEPSELLEVYIE